MKEVTVLMFMFIDIVRLSTVGQSTVYIPIEKMIVFGLDSVRIKLQWSTTCEVYVQIVLQRFKMRVSLFDYFVRIYINRTCFTFSWESFIFVAKLP